MRATAAQSKVQLRKIIQRTKEQMGYNLTSFAKGGVVTYYHKNKPDKSGTVYTGIETLPAQLQRVSSETKKEYMQKIFAMSQKLVPVDKRFVGINIKDKNSIKLSNYRARPLVSIAGYSKDIGAHDYFDSPGVEGRLTNFRLSLTDGGGTEKVDYKVLDAEGLINKTAYLDYGYADLYVGSGYYSGDKADFIRKYLLGTNRRKTEGLFYNEDDGNIYARKRKGQIDFTKLSGVSLKMRSKRVDNKKAFSSNIQPTGGFQELREGGKISKDFSQITYSAFDQSRKGGGKFNYAALQHDNLTFRHKYGEAQFLAKSVAYYQEELVRKMKERISKTFERGK